MHYMVKDWMKIHKTALQKMWEEQDLKKLPPLG